MNYKLLCAIFLMSPVSVQTIKAMESVPLTPMQEVERAAGKLKIALANKNDQSIKDNFSQFVERINKVDALLLDEQPVTVTTDDLGFHVGIEMMKTVCGIETPQNKDFAIIKKADGSDEKQVILSKDTINAVGYCQDRIKGQIEKLKGQEVGAAPQSPELLLVKTFLGITSWAGAYYLLPHLYTPYVLDKTAYYTTIVAMGFVGAYTIYQSYRLLIYTEYKKNQQAKIKKLNEKQLDLIILRDSFETNFKELKKLTLYTVPKTKNGNTKTPSNK